MRRIPEDKKEIIRIGIPAILDSLIAVIVTTIDTKMISPLGAAVVSAVSITSQPKLLFLAIFYALGTTASIFISQALGKKDREEANDYFHRILRLTIAASLVLGGLLMLLAEPVIRLCSCQEDTIGLSAEFFRIIMGFMVFQTVSIVLNAALRAVGKTNVTLISAAATGAVDILVNYLLIEGHWGFPRMGVAGDAIATVAGTVAACLVSGIYLARHSDFLTLRGLLRRPGKNPEAMKNIRSKAGNTVFENLFTRIGFLLSGIVVSLLPSDKTAVYFVAMLLLNYTFAFGDGLQSTLVMLTGRSVGAGDPEGLRKYVRGGRAAGLAVAAALSVIFVAGAHFFFGLFFSDEPSVAEGVQYSWVAAALTFLQIFRLVNTAAMRGMGEVKHPRIIATVCVLVINPALSYLLSAVCSFEVWGIWQASLVTQFIWCLLTYIKTTECLRKLEKAQKGSDKGGVPCC